MFEDAIAGNVWRVSDGVYRILLPVPWDVSFVNVYVMESRGKFLLVDCGSDWGPSKKALSRSLRRIGVREGELEAVILTHNHLDHAGAWEWVREYWGGRVFVHPRDAGERGLTPELLVEWFAVHGVPEEYYHGILSSKATPGWQQAVRDASLLSADSPMRHGDLSIQIIEAPGHTAGHVLIWEPDRRWLFSADQLFETMHGPNTWVLPDCEMDSLADYFASLHKIKCIQSELIFPGHGATATGDQLQSMVEGAFRFYEEELNKVQEFLRNGPSSTWEVTAALNRLDERDYRMATVRLAETLPLLLYLKGRGLVQEVGSGTRIWKLSDAGSCSHSRGGAVE